MAGPRAEDRLLMSKLARAAAGSKQHDTEQLEGAAQPSPGPEVGKG